MFSGILTTQKIESCRAIYFFLNKIEMQRQHLSYYLIQITEDIT